MGSFGPYKNQYTKNKNYLRIYLSSSTFFPIERNNHVIGMKNRGIHKNLSFTIYLVESQEDPRF